MKYYYVLSIYVIWMKFDHFSIVFFSNDVLNNSCFVEWFSKNIRRSIRLTSAKAIVKTIVAIPKEWSTDSHIDSIKSPTLEICISKSLIQWKFTEFHWIFETNWLKFRVNFFLGAGLTWENAQLFHTEKLEFECIERIQIL